jgi:hypothetical protein
VSFHLDLFIYEWEMVCGFSSVFVSGMKYSAIGELTSWVRESIIDDVWISQGIVSLIVQWSWRLGNNAQ